MSNYGFRIRLTRVVMIALTYVWCAGCIVVPVRVPTKTISVSGATGKKLDLDFIKVGSTSHEEVLQKLGWVDAGIKNDKLFVGRWADSAWGVAWVAGGGYSGTAGWNRSWTTHDLILDFNDQGITEGMSFVSDKDIGRMLDRQLSKHPSGPLDPATPIILSVEYVRSGTHVPGILTLGRDDLKFLQKGGVDSKVAFDFKTLPANLSHLTTGNTVASHSSHPEYVVVTVHFKQKTPVGRKFTVQVDLPTTATLLQYLRYASGSSAVGRDSNTQDRRLPESTDR